MSSFQLKMDEEKKYVHAFQLGKTKEKLDYK